jgi:5-methylcytosine-specific restriction protein A
MTWSRTSRHDRGYGTAWDKLRRHIMQRDKHLCQPCKRASMITPAQQVDHIIPKAKGGTDDEDNLQAICKTCHEGKTIQDSGGRPKVQIGADGWPV